MQKAYTTKILGYNIFTVETFRLYSRSISTLLL